MQKITKILQNRLLKLQKFKNALILSQIKEIQLFHYSAINSLITKTSYHHPYYMILMGYLIASRIYVTEKKQTKLNSY